MKPADVQDFSSFVSELHRESDRGLALVGGALIDDRLLETLRAFFCEGVASKRLLEDGAAPLGTFSSRSDACFALGLIDAFEHREIALIRKVRNEFAHAKHGMSFKTAKVAGFCSTLASDLPLGSDYPINEPRFRFTNAVVVMASRLYYRPAWVEKERRQGKSWVDPKDVRWRSIDEEMPPSGLPVIGMAKRQPR